MTRRVGIVGIGTTGFRATTPDVSFRELTYEAAVKAYLDAGVEPKDIDAFVSTAEDFSEGYSIADEYSPDQLGAVLKPIHTVPGDFIQSLGNGFMWILSGDADIVAVQGLSKASNIMNHHELVTFALDPWYGRQLRESPYFMAGLEMSRFMHETGTTRAQCAEVVVRNRLNALKNPRANHGCALELEQVLDSEPVSEPLRRLDIAQASDGAVVVVLASEEAARSLGRTPVWVRGIGWGTETPNLETRSWGTAEYTAIAAAMAYRQAGIRSPGSEIDFFEVNDLFSYKQLQHLIALGVFGASEVGQAIATGVMEPGGKVPVNVSGGCLGMGTTMELDGGQRVLEVVLQLRGEAGANQLREVNTGLACSWRGLSTATGGVAVLSN